MRTRSASVAVLLVLTACSGTTASETVIRVIMADDWAGTAPVVDVVRRFEASHPDVRVQIEPVAFEFMAEAIESGITAGDPVDVAQFHAFAMGALGLAERVDDLWSRHALTEDEFFPGTVDDVRWGDALYGVPLDANAMLMVFNADAFRAADVPEPQPGYTFADLREMAERLDTVESRALSFSSSTWRMFGWIVSNGGDVVRIGPDGSATFTFDLPQNVETLSFLAELVRDDLAFPPLGRLGDLEDAFELLRSEATTMLPTGSWDLAGLEHAGVDWARGVAVMPSGARGRAGSGGSVLGGSSLLIPAGARNKDLAFEFMLAMIDDEAGVRLAREEGRLPARLSVYDDPFFQTAEMRTFFDQMLLAKPFLLEAFPAEHTIFRQAILTILRGERGAAAALADAQERVDERSG